MLGSCLHLLALIFPFLLLCVALLVCYDVCSGYGFSNEQTVCHSLLFRRTSFILQRKSHPFNYHFIYYYYYYDFEIKQNYLYIYIYINNHYPKSNPLIILLQYCAYTIEYCIDNIIIFIHCLIIQYRRMSLSVSLELRKFINSILS